jgi:hypothetical protein
MQHSSDMVQHSLDGSALACCCKSLDANLGGLCLLSDSNEEIPEDLGEYDLLNICVNVNPKPGGLFANMTSKTHNYCVKSIIYTKKLEKMLSFISVLYLIL